jgi:hypothetical protein
MTSTDDHIPETAFELFDTDSTTIGKRPATIIQALMETAPGDALPESLEEADPLIQEIRKAQENTLPQDRYVLDAISVEGLTFQQLAERLGVSQTQAHRMYHAALDRLRTCLLSSEKVRERLGLEPTWENACYNELEAIAQETTTIDGQFMYYLMDEFGDAIHEQEKGDTVAAERHLTKIAAYSIMHLQNIKMWDTKKQVELMSNKHHDYGVNNINKFGKYGVLVRLSDKLCRLENLSKNGKSPRNESVTDTHLDIIGYVTIYRMLCSVTFMLPS